LLDSLLQETWRTQLQPVEIVVVSEEVLVIEAEVAEVGAGVTVVGVVVEAAAVGARKTRNGSL